MQRIHVITRKEDVDPARAAGKVVVVLDVLYATSTIAAALEHGASEVVPALDPDAAREAAVGLAPDSYLLAGERHLEPIPGFVTYAPLSITRESLAGRRLIYSTTNGTVALSRTEGAAAVYAAALLNGAAVAEAVARRHQQITVLLVCAGASGAFNIEDFYGAGYLLDTLCGAQPQRWSLSDAAIAARELYRALADRPAQVLLDSQLGRRLQALGQSAEVEYAAQPGRFRTVPRLQEGRLVVER